MGRPLQVLCLHGGEDHDGPESFKPLVLALKEAGMSSVVRTDAPDLFQLAGGNVLRVTTKPDCPMMTVGQVVPVPVIDEVDRIVGMLLDKHGHFEGEPVVLVGINIGAVVALRFAASLRERNGFPWRLYAANPPATFPNPAPGALGACNVTCIIPEPDQAGERWRFSIATKGAYRVAVTKEADSSWAKLVVDDLAAAFPSLG